MLNILNLVWKIINIKARKGLPKIFELKRENLENKRALD